MTTEKEKISEMNRLKRKLWNKEPKNFTEVAELGRQIGYIQGELAGKSEAISSFAEKIKKELRHNVFEITLDDGTEGVLKDAKVLNDYIDKLVEEQSSGETKC